MPLEAPYQPVPVEQALSVPRRNRSERGWLGRLCCGSQCDESRQEFSWRARKLSTLSYRPVILSRRCFVVVRAHFGWISRFYRAPAPR
jgi:hypothetical protein